MSKINGAKAGEFLYEEVLERNFEIIESFLSKFHTVFEKQDSLDQAIQKIQQRILSIEKKNASEIDKLQTANEIIDNHIHVIKQHINNTKFSIQKPDQNQTSFQLVITNSTHEFNEKLYEGLCPYIEKCLGNYQFFKQSEFTQFEERYKSISHEIDSLKQKIQSTNYNKATVYEFPQFLEGSKYSPQFNTTEIYKSEIQQEFTSLKKQIIREFNCFKNLIMSQILQKASVLDKKIEKIGTLQQATNNEPTKKQYEQLKDYFIKLHEELAVEVEQNFAHKSETKATFVYLQKKIKKLELIEGFLFQKNESENNNQLAVSSTSKSFKSRIKNNVHRKLLASTLHDEKLPIPMASKVKISKNGIEADLVTKCYGRSKMMDSDAFMNTIS